jgi:hypothetical protein
MPARNPAPCICCTEMIEISEAAISICIYCRTVGIEPALRAPQDQVYCCATCAEAMAMGKTKPSKNQPVLVVMYNQICSMIASDPTITLRAWGQLRKSQGLAAPRFSDGDLARSLAELRRSLELPTGDEVEIPPVEILPPRRALNPAS